MSKAKEEAEAIYNKHYCSILEYGEELSEEIVISLLAKKSASIHVEGIIDEMNEFENSFSGYGGLKMKTRISQLKEVKQELNKML